MKNQRPALALGTAQFGLAYGATNTHGQISLDTAEAILNDSDSKVVYLDTAAAYGNAESVLGQLLPAQHGFKIISKIPSGTQPSEINTLTRECLKKLRQERLDTMLLHDADALLRDDADATWNALQSIKTAGLCAQVGVSVYDAATAEAIAARFPLDCVQLPLNILDQRSVQSGALQRLQALGIKIHARSIFLQGILLLEPALLPAPLQRFRQPLEIYQHLRSRAGLTPLRACLGYVKSQEALDAVVVGVSSHYEWDELWRAWYAPPAAADWAAFALSEPSDLLDPRRWPTAEKAAA